MSEIVQAGPNEIEFRCKVPAGAEVKRPDDDFFGHVYIEGCEVTNAMHLMQVFAQGMHTELKSYEMAARCPTIAQYNLRVGRKIPEDCTTKLKGWL